jgi:hypothetical protein
VQECITCSEPSASTGNQLPTCSVSTLICIYAAPHEVFRSPNRNTAIAAVAISDRHNSFTGLTNTWREDRIGRNRKFSGTVRHQDERVGYVRYSCSPRSVSAAASSGDNDFFLAFSFLREGVWDS